MLDLKTNFGKATCAVISIIFVVLLYEQVLEKNDGKSYKPQPGTTCRGDPIEVSYPYHGGMLQPHACKPQCKDDKQRYILYTNGKATQCQTPPGCLDWGEDQGVTCEPPK